MAKVKKKKKKNGDKPEEKKKRVTIVSMARTMFEENPQITSKQMQNKVLELHPDSKFKSSHWSFYKNKFKDDIDFSNKKDDTEEEVPGKKKKKKGLRRRKNAA